jgi:hypothetical protein
VAEPRLGPLHDAPGGRRPRCSASAFPLGRATAPSTPGTGGASRSGFLRRSQPRGVPTSRREAGPLAFGLQVETRRLEAGVPSSLPPQPQAGEAPALSLGALRHGTRVELAGSQGEATLYLPVNPGLEPQDLELKLSLPAGLLQGCLDVLSEGYPSFYAILPTETPLSTRSRNLSLHHISKPLSLGRARVHFTPNTCRVPGPGGSWTNLPSPLVDAQSFSNGEETPPAGGYRVQALPGAPGDPPPNGPVRGEEKAGRGHPEG